MSEQFKVNDRIFRGNNKNRIGTVTAVFSNYIFVSITTGTGTVNEKWPHKECHLAD